MARSPANRLRWSPEMAGPSVDAAETTEQEGRKSELAPAAEQTSLLARWAKWLPLVIVLAGLAAYGNSIYGSFVFDDQPAIVDNPHLRQFASPSSWWADTTRPLVQFTLAMNFALGGIDPRGYHVVNVAAHLAAALVLFGLVRRTLVLREMPDALKTAAAWLAGSVALLWVVHPLTTASVTYLIQRSEVLMGLFYLLVLYALVRGVEAGGAKLWFAAAVLSCWAGMASKEVMVTAPVVALLFDRVYLAGNWREIAQRRWGLYAGLASSWALLAVLLRSAPKVFATVGFGQTKVGGWEYAVNQPAVILHYLRLAVWPNPLVIDYGWPVTSLGENLLPIALVAGLVALSVGLCLTRPVGPLVRGEKWGGAKIGFLGLAFFVILAPTSSIVPIADLAFEQRMYLPLAAVIALAVVGGYQLLPRLASSAAKRLPEPTTVRAAFGLVLAVAMVLAIRTMVRNVDYYSELALWESTVAARPDNARAHDQMCVACLHAGDPERALLHAELAVALEPNFAVAHNNLGRALDGLHAHGFHPDSPASFKRAIELAPDFPDPHNNLANVLLRQGRMLEALDHYRIALKAWPDSAKIHYHLAITLARLGEPAQAIDHFHQALASAERDRLANMAILVPLHVDLGETLAQSGDLAQARVEFEAALALRTDSIPAHIGLAKVLLGDGKLDLAIEHLQKAIALAPNRIDSHLTLARVFLAKGDPARAAVEYERVLKIAPTNADAHYFLGICADEQGQPEEAVKHLRQAIKHRPGWPEASLDLAWMLATNRKAGVRDGAEAVRLIEEYCQTAGNLRPRAWDTLGAAYAESGRYKDAIAAAEKGIDLADASKTPPEPGHSSDDMQLRLQFYRTGAPFRAVREE